MATKILALTSEPISADALRSAVGSELGDDAEVFVIAPALNSRLHFLVGDVDPAIARAEEVQTETVERLDEEGIDAAGETGESDPLLALEDALQTYPADMIVLFIHPEGRRNFLEEGLLEKVRERFELPVSHLIVE